MPLDKNKIAAEATRFVQKGQYDKALKAYEKILAEDRNEVRTLLKVGEIHQKRGDLAAAAATFNHVAEIYGEQGFFLKAVAVYKQIAKLTPDDVRVHEKLAGLYQQLGLLNDATSQLQAVATAYERTGEQGKHLDVLRRLLDLDPENVVTCQRLGDLYAGAGRNLEALELYRRAAAHLRENRRGDEYLKVAERIFQLAPQDLVLAKELAREYLSHGDTKKALGKLQVCHGADKQDVETLRLMAQAFRDLGQVSKTIAVYRALARACVDRGLTDEATSIWRTVLELLPEDTEAREELAASRRSVPTPPPVAAWIPEAPSPAPQPPGPAIAPPPPVRAPAPVPERQSGTPSPGLGQAPPASVARLLTETDVYLKYGLHKKALEHLQTVLAIDPESPDALERIRDSLEATGDRAGAVDAAERALRSLSARGDAARLARAHDRLGQLDAGRAAASPVPAGGAVPPASAPPAPPVGMQGIGEPGIERTATSDFPIRVPPDEEVPREVGEPEGPAPVQDDEGPTAIHAYPGHGLVEEHLPDLDGAPPAPPVVLGDASPLPVEDLPTGSDAEVEEVEIEAIEPADHHVPAPLQATQPPAPAVAWPALESEMDEVDFYERQGLTEEALLAVQDLLELHPGHPVLVEALARIEHRAAEEAQGSGAAPPARRSAVPAPSAARSTGTTGIFDLGAELSAELGPDLTPAPSGEFQYSVADVFDQFKRGLERTIRPDDSATKYDLGIAFQEMGMLDEALEQFRSALAGGDRRRDVEILTMIGNCLGMKGQHREAIEAFRQALGSEFLEGPAAMALHFDLGRAHEAIGEPGVALWYYQKIARSDPGYRGVATRVARLGGGPGVAPTEKPGGPGRAGRAVADEDPDQPAENTAEKR